MQLSANNIEHIFLIACALYVLVECFACARQVIAAERGIGRVPEGFCAKLSLSAHQKAAAYTTEAAQSRLVLAFASTAFSVLMTSAHGLTYFAAFLETLTDNTLLVEWALVVGVMAMLSLIELPLDWLSRYRLKERFGYQRRTRSEWLKLTAGTSTAGWAAALPAAAVILVLCELAGAWWWLVLWLLYLARILWRWRLSLMQGRLWSRASRPMKNEALRRKLRALLAEEGLHFMDAVLTTRPPAWKHAHVLLAGSGPSRTVVVFADAAAKLTEEELLAVVASQAARLKLKHGPWRVALSALGGLFICAVLGWASASPEFFDGLGFSPLLTVEQPGSHAGFAMAAALLTFPIIFFPLRILSNWILRRMRYAADRSGAARMGGDALARALAKLHRDYSNTLTPSRFYSLLHYEHPHASMRVAELLQHMRSRGLEPRLASPVPEAPSVLALEQKIARKTRPSTEAPRTLRRKAENELADELLSRTQWADDDGFAENDGKTSDASAEAAPKAAQGRLPLPQTSSKSSAQATQQEDTNHG